MAKFTKPFLKVSQSVFNFNLKILNSYIQLHFFQFEGFLS